MKVEMQITQVHDGLEYDAQFMFPSQKLNVKVRFGVHLSQLEDTARGQSKEETLKLFSFFVIDGESERIVTDNFKPLLVATVGTLAVDMFYSPQTEDHRARGVLGLTTVGSPNRSKIMSDLIAGGAEVEISMTRTLNVPDDHPQITEFLRTYCP